MIRYIAKNKKTKKTLLPGNYVSLANVNKEDKAGGERVGGGKEKE